MIWIVAGLLWGLLKKSRPALIISFIALTLLSNPLLVNFALQKWETPRVRKDQIPLNDMAVVLTGVTTPGYLPADQVHFSESADRATEILALYHEALIQRMIISGGSSSLSKEQIPESVILREYFVALDVKTSDITIDTLSRNTYENAFQTKNLLDKKGLADRKILLVTSAFHMPRAEKCFKKQGLDVFPYPVDFRSRHVDIDPVWLIPSASALSSWKILI